MDSSIESAVPCPGCGGEMRWMQPLDGSGPVAICPTCSSESTPIETGSEAAQTPPSQPSPTEPDSHFRKLLSEAEAYAEAPLAEDMLEELPREAQELLSQGKAHRPRKQEKELREDIAASLREQGYVISHDGHGLRISSELSSSGREQAPMSPYDIIRIAADLEGGVMSAEERRHCGKCQAVIPIGDDQCQMCGEPAPPPKTPE